jgi:hypothetical protein
MLILLSTSLHIHSQPLFPLILLFYSRVSFVAIMLLYLLVSIVAGWLKYFASLPSRCNSSSSILFRNLQALSSPYLSLFLLYLALLLALPPRHRRLLVRSRWLLLRRRSSKSLRRPPCPPPHPPPHLRSARTHSTSSLVATAVLVTSTHQPLFIYIWRELTTCPTRRARKCRHASAAAASSLTIKYSTITNCSLVTSLKTQQLWLFGLFLLPLRPKRRPILGAVASAVLGQARQSEG